MAMYKLCLLISVILSQLKSVYTYRECNETFNSNKCRFDLICIDTFYYSHDFNYYRMNYDNDRIRRDDCVHVVDHQYSDYFLETHLIYKASSGFFVNEDNNNIPKYNPNQGNDRISLITYIDLSDNNYESIPTLREMENLSVLNLSRNSITVAKLSNQHPLPALKEIDLSHNTISDMQYTLEDVYSSLKIIDLSHNYFTAIPDAAFEPFDELENLDLSHNFIDTIGPITFEGTKKLLHLNLSHNRISDINSSLFRFIELIELDLSHNKINSIQSHDFNKLINLETLNLNSNFISTILRDTFRNMASMKNIYLNHNKLESVDRDVFTNVTSLVTIDISNNNLKILPKGVFKNQSIQMFFIQENQLEGSIAKGMFEGLSLVNKLDLSNQNVHSVEDYAFFGLNNLRELILNNNNIETLSLKCFRTMVNLNDLDLSSNQLKSIEFEKDDLYNLISLSLRNNHLSDVRHEHFNGLRSLQFLDLSDNKIKEVESNSFISLKELINFQISNNPLSGTLKESTFDGLNSLPTLDISCSLLTIIQNGSFSGMIQLKSLNVSHSKIKTLEYNTFVHTGAIETMDLSFNELKQFNINGTELSRLNELYLSNNFITTISANTFQSTAQLTKLTLSNNNIESIETNVFSVLKYLRELDVSNNPHFQFTLTFLNSNKNLDRLDLSGLRTSITFGKVKDMSLSRLRISNSSVADVKKLQINELRHLDDLSLSNNDITKLEVGAFSNMTSLRTLDVSHNNISFIQPGVFKDNTLLFLFNVSHNSLTTVSYGIFRGLIFLHTLDISYNSISDLRNERFYEVKGLSILVADHNKIESISPEEFMGTSLSELSIGDNPIPCEMLVSIQRGGVPYQITANRLDDSNNENVNGVSCNKKSQNRIFDITPKVGTPMTGENTNILLSMRDILQNYFNNNNNKDTSVKIDEQYFDNITKRIEKSNDDISERLSGYMNTTLQIIPKNVETNVLLDKILRVLTLNSIRKSAEPAEVTKANATYENLVSYVKNVKQDLEDTMALQKTVILSEVDTKISELKSHISFALSTEMPKHEKFSVESTESKSIFTEACVGLILTIMVGFILFKIYKSRVYVSQRFSASTRELPGAMDTISAL